MTNIERESELSELDHLKITILVSTGNSGSEVKKKWILFHLTNWHRLDRKKNLKINILESTNLVLKI